MIPKQPILEIIITEAANGIIVQFPLLNEDITPFMKSYTKGIGEVMRDNDEVEQLIKESKEQATETEQKFIPMPLQNKNIFIFTSLDKALAFIKQVIIEEKIN